MIVASSRPSFSAALSAHCLAPAALLLQVTLPPAPSAVTGQVSSGAQGEAGVRAGKPGEEPPTLGLVGGSAKQRPAGARTGERPDLLLPSAPPKSPGPAASEASADPPPAEIVPLSPALEPAPNSLAAMVLAEVRKTEDPRAPLVIQAARTLSELGPDGTAAARRALADAHPPLVALGARVLIGSGEAADYERVWRRFDEKLSSTAGAELVALLAELEPSRTSPRALAKLLAHALGGVRVAAARELAKLPGEQLAQAVPEALQVSSADGRLRALNLAAQVGPPRDLEWILPCLKDRSPQVAARAAWLLAAREGEEVEGELLRRAFRDPWILREHAYALFALVLREDVLVRPILLDAHADTLLAGLVSSDAFVSGACALALSGIGFRVPTERAPNWYEDEVPAALVRTVASREFHADLEVLRESAAKRLAMISGELPGTDGPSWAAWWLANHQGFRGRRAALPVGEALRPSLRVRSTGARSQADVLELWGPALAASGGALEAPPLGVERVFLTELQARELFELLRGLGLFGPERLPGLRGDASAGVRRLELSLGQASKEFAFALPKGADWFEQAVQAVRALAERNRWQAFCAADSPAERLGQWREQAEWWDEEGDALARERRLKQLVLAWLERAEPSQRQAGVDELARLGQRQGVLDSADFPRLLALLRAEPFLGARARALVDLAVVLARDPAGSPQDTALDPARAAELNALLIDRFEAQAAPDVARILRATGESAVLAAAADERALVRAMAVNALADSALAAAPQAREPLLAALRERLQDADARVQSAAHLAIGRVKDERALSQVTIAARLADPPVRASALRALGALGGENALDALVVGMANREFPEVALGATWGLAELGDPRSASLLVSLLAKDPDDPLFEAAQSGLLRLGPAAHEALFKTLTAKPRAPRRAAALLLSRQGVCDAAPALISLLAEDPLDERVSLELAVLSARDLRQEKNPAQAWWDWWDGAVQDDSLAWFLGALQRQGAAGLERSDFAGSGQGRAREFLLDVLQRGEVHWVERARRELARMLGREIAPPPPSEGQRERYFAHLREELSGLDS